MEQGKKKRNAFVESTSRRTHDILRPTHTHFPPAAKFSAIHIHALVFFSYSLWSPQQKTIQQTIFDWTRREGYTCQLRTVGEVNISTETFGPQK
eukprot:GEMP01091733.1.p1 GENE.GEMP01091733.1~~GEMP01091733.1.p1  ORF type:complete len:104 (+),score=1.33 GEMP01091733.1:33-314(+)